MDGHKSRGDLAEGAGVEKKVYHRDFEKEKKIYIRNNRQGTPPRRTTTVYPNMSGFLNYMSRGLERSLYNEYEAGGRQPKYDMDDKDSVKLFVEAEKPLIMKTNNRKWKITKWGRQALRQLDGV